MALVNLVSTIPHRTPHRLAKQVERMVLADLRRPISIAKISHKLGVSDRHLRKVFEVVHGIPPSQYLRMLRLSRARRALLSARGRSVTVSKIATRLGFFELGRFSVEYRKLFGESPSETLHKAVREHERRRRALVKRKINC
jgi:AraC-like DNA-binding protein